MPRRFWSAFFLFIWALPVQAQLQKFCLPGIAPTHHVTSFELTPATSVTSGGRDITHDTLTGKLYYAVSPAYKLGAEVPLARHQSEGDAVKGLGDVLLSVQAVQSVYKVDWGVKMEAYLPTATADELGSGKWQAVPSVFALYPFSPSLFVSAEYKQFFSVAGSSSREDINYGRILLTFSYMAPSQWWFTFEPQYYLDYEHPGQAVLMWEGEIGVMVNQGTALYLKPGTRLGGNWERGDWSLSAGFKILYL